MLATKGCVFVIICAFMVLVQCKLSTRERLKAEKECVEEVNIDYGIILDVKHTLVVSDDVKYKQFLNCFYTKQGFKTKNGEIKFNELKEVLLSGYTSQQADQILKPCKEINPADLDDLPVLILKCIILNASDVNNQSNY